MLLLIQKKDDQMTSVVIHIIILILMIIGIFSMLRKTQTNLKIHNATKNNETIKNAVRHKNSIKNVFNSKVIGFAIAGFLVFSGLQILPIIFRSGPFNTQFMMIPFLLAAVGIFFLLPFLIKKMENNMEEGHAKNVPDVETALDNDKRAPVLYLRSFSIDGSRRQKVPLLETLSIQDHTYEVKLVSIFSRLGPVIAIGKPNEALPELGAFREWGMGSSLCLTLVVN